jgi:serine/threonine protein kinase
MMTLKVETGNPRERIMKPTLCDLLLLLRQAASPRDVFGPLPADGRFALRARYRELVAIAHPDHTPRRAVEANEAFRLLREWYTAAQRSLDRGAYDACPRIHAVGRLHQYTGYEPPLRGDLCDLFRADAAGDRVLLKVARRARDNDLLQAEARALRRIAHKLNGEPLRAHFPTLIEHFLLRDESGSQRHTNVLRAEAGYTSLADVIRAYPGGIDAADGAWMFNRMLAALGVVHDLGIVHAAILPTHILIRPSDHNAILIDWCYSVAAGGVVQAISPPYAGDYPPEVRAKQPSTPATDLYMAARCMLRLLGGGGMTQDLPARVPKPIQAFLQACLIPAPQRRPSDAWELFDDFQKILRRLYGPPTFRPFRMP